MVDIVFYDKAQLKKIEEAIDKRDWFTAIVLSATQIERHGSRKIKQHLTEHEIKPELCDALLEMLYLMDIAKALKIIDIITPKEYKRILELNTERKSFIHQREHKTFKKGKEAEEKYKPLIIDAIKILREKLDVVHIAVADTGMGGVDIKFPDWKIK